MVDDLLQLSYLQRLARQKIVEMEVRRVVVQLQVLGHLSTYQLQVRHQSS